MKKNILHYSLILVFSGLIIFPGCDDDPDDPTPTCVGGKGGSVSFVLQPEHHGKAIPSQPTYLDSAFIKYNTNDFPGDNPALYDRIVVGTAGSAIVIADSMKCGKYFIYMTGYDTSIVERVRGGIPVNIQIQTGPIAIKVPVTED